jgi:DNA-binding NarL/FixJ family response regulator
VSTAVRPPWRVLIADDHAPTRADVRRVLDHDERFEVCAEAADAAAAVQAALREKPDICLLDLGMPGNGLAAVWEIAARMPETKIVILTVSDQEANLFAALRAGASGYLPKTMNLARLPDTLDGVCNGEAAMPRKLMTHVLQRYRRREPRWRQTIGAGQAQRRLTSREWEVLDLLAQGQSTSEIAERLVISPTAVRVHIASVVHKLKVPDRAAAVELFRRRSGALAFRNLNGLRRLGYLRVTGGLTIRWHRSHSQTRLAVVNEQYWAGLISVSLALPAGGSRREFRGELRGSGNERWG